MDLGILGNHIQNPGAQVGQCPLGGAQGAFLSSFSAPDDDPTPVGHRFRGTRNSRHRHRGRVIPQHGVKEAGKNRLGLVVKDLGPPLVVPWVAPLDLVQCPIGQVLAPVGEEHRPPLRLLDGGR